MHSLSKLDSEALSLHGRAVRTLARSLLGDGHAAEDVEQETWVAFLRRDGALPERLSAWLSSVARRMALRRARTEGRRRRREACAAAPERLEPLQQRSLEREEALRALTQALLALEEPLKTALILRYYEERTPTEIAAGLGIPLATVKSRLARGLERLRARLGAEPDGKGRATLALLAGLREGAGPATPAGVEAPAGLGLGVGLALAGLAASALVLVPVVLGRGATEPPAQGALAALALAPQEGARPVPAPREPADASRTDTAALDGERQALEPEASAPEAGLSLPAGAAFVYRLEGRVRDRFDRPLPDAVLYLAPGALPLNRVATTDAEGRFAVEFAGRTPDLTCRFTAGFTATSLGLRELHLRAGQPLQVDVALEVDHTPDAGKLWVEARLVEEQRARATRSVAQGAQLSSLRRRSDSSLAGQLACAPQAELQPDGRIVFRIGAQGECSRESESESESVLSLARVGSEPMLEQRRQLLEQVEVEKMSRSMLLRERAGTLAVNGPSAPTAVLSGCVLSVDGRPVADAQVSWGPATGARVASLTSDAEGVFTLTGLPVDQELLVTAGGGDEGLARTLVTLTAGLESRWTAVLDRGEEVRGRIRAGGSPLPGARIELWNQETGRLWCDRTRSGLDGEFAFPNVPPGSFELLVFHGEDPESLPVRVVPAVSPRFPLEDVRLAPEDLIRNALTLTLHEAAGGDLAGVVLSAWPEGGASGLVAKGPDPEGRYRLEGLPRGTYRVEVGGKIPGRVLATRWVEGDTDLGTEVVATFGLAVLAADGDVGRLRLELWSAQPEVFAHAGSFAGEGRAAFALRAGEYLVSARRASGPGAEFPLEVVARATRGLTLAAGEGGRLTAHPGATDPAAASESARSARCTVCHSGAGG